jgi:hypothetical protein
MNNVQLLAVFKELERRIAEVDIRQGGPQGPRGTVGPKGRKGDKGTTGPTGPSGKSGTQGLKGPQGTSGKDGSSGKDGLRGPQGLSGVDGSDGAAGLHGQHGSAGKDGISVTDVQIDFDGHLTVSMSDGTTIDAGGFDNHVGDTIVYTGGSGGGSGGSGGPVPPHNDLDGLEGTGPEYYHLNQAEYDQLIEWINEGIGSDRNVDGGAPDGVYLPSQLIDGGTP